MIKVNGEMLEIAEGTTVAAFLKEHEEYRYAGCSYESKVCFYR